MCPITITRWAVLDCDGKPLGMDYPWLYDSEEAARQIAAYFSNSTVTKVKVRIEEA